MAKDPAVITAALKAALPGAGARDRKAFDKVLGYGTELEGADVDAVDANGDTAVVRLAKRALAGRVSHWVSEGTIGDDDVSYTITDGVMVFRKRNRETKMQIGSECLIAKKWCPEHYAFLTDLLMIHNLFFYGASLTTKGKDRKTVRQHLDALEHPFIAQAIADHPKLLRKHALRVGGAKRRAAARSRTLKTSARRKATPSKARAT